MDIIGYVSKLQSNVFQIRHDDDFADRLNYRYTIAILVAFAVIVTNRQFSESVIKCWVPAYFTPNFEAYANQVCWISNTYFVNQTEPLSKNDDLKKSTEIKYYQWIPFILLIQSLFLYIPRLAWRILSCRAGLDLRDLSEAANSYKSVEKFKQKDKILEYIVNNVDQYLANPRRLKSRDSLRQKILYFIESFCFGSGIYLGNYMVTTYLFTKILYLANSIVQFFVMNEFLGKQFNELGVDIVLRYLTMGESAHGLLESVYFPKIVMCDFYIREFGHPNISHLYRLQCVLPLNLYNQQIFTFLWFWFFVLFLANLYALINLIINTMPQKRKSYINKRIDLFHKIKSKLKRDKDNSLEENDDLLNTNKINSEIKKVNSDLDNSLEEKDNLLNINKINSELKKVNSDLDNSLEEKDDFLNIYLKWDGVFIIRMISILSSEITANEILYKLWEKKTKKVESKTELNDDTEVINNKEKNHNSLNDQQQDTVLSESENLKPIVHQRAKFGSTPSLRKKHVSFSNLFTNKNFKN